MSNVFDRTIVQGPAASEPFLEIVFDALRAVNSASTFGQAIELSAQTVLIGSNSCLDSLQLLTLISAVQTTMQQYADKPLALLDDQTLFDEDGPLRTVATFARYLREFVLSGFREDD